MAVWSEEKICVIDDECSTFSVEPHHPDRVVFTIRSADNHDTLSVHLSVDEALAFCTHAMRVIKNFAKEIK